MKTGSLRLRVTAFALTLLVVVLAGVITGVTLVYRSRLEDGLRHRLRTGASAVRRAGSGPALKPVIQSLSLEGIAADIRSGPARLSPAKQAQSGLPPVKLGLEISSSGSLLRLDEILADGTRIRLSASRTHIDSSVASLFEIELGVALAALALAALVLLQGTARALRPLTEVARTAAEIAGGDASRRLQPTRADTELGRMASAFDLMVDSLDGAIVQARDAEEAMRRFLADASHELRTPIAALQASVETLLREQPPRPLRDALEATIARDAARLGRLVDDLLGLARLEANETAPRQPLDLAEVAREATERARLRSFGADMSLHLGQGTRVLGDADSLVGALRNLVENALAAARSGGHVKIAVRTVDTEAEARVTDDGPGIPEADRERIFERFVRLDGAGSGGTGLGLAIARRTARRHGGDVTCDAVNRGASFTMRLPLYSPTSGPSSTA